MSGSYLLREYISSILQERYKNVGRKLRVFDFDDTLVKTGSMIHVDGGYHATGA